MSTIAVLKSKIEYSTGRKVYRCDACVMCSDKLQGTAKSRYSRWCAQHGFYVVTHGGCKDFTPRNGAVRGLGRV